MALKEGQLVTYAIDEIIETVQNLTPMASKVTKYTLRQNPCSVQATPCGCLLSRKRQLRLAGI